MARILGFPLLINVSQTSPADEVASHFPDSSHFRVTIPSPSLPIMWARTFQVSRSVANTAGLTRPARRLHSGRGPLRELSVTLYPYCWNGNPLNITGQLRHRLGQG